jgi:enoyl-CoA hydratase/carnithine racemase
MSNETTPGGGTRVTVTVEGGVADVRLNRPEKINALDPAMFEAIVAAGQSVAADPSVRAVVLSGEGRGFCAGLDFSSFQAMAGAERGSRVTRDLGDRPEGRITNLGQDAAYVWTEMPVPVIAAVHGVALGGGFQIALGADIRFVAPDTRMSVLEIRWGLIPDMTGTHMLRRLLPLDVAKELTWTGRMVSGTEAVELGLATHLSDDPRADALALAAEIAAKNPLAVRAAKRLLNQSGQVSAE